MGKIKKAMVLSLLFTIIFTFLSFAKPIDSDSAINAGKHHFHVLKALGKGRLPIIAEEPFKDREYSVLAIKELIVDGKLLAYILDLIPEGFIVLSTDTDIRPIIAYSPNGNFPMEDNADNTLLFLLKRDMKNRLSAIPVMSDKSKKQNNALWQDYLNQDKPFMDQIISAQQWGPYLVTTWGQGEPYNTYCPLDPANSERCVVGCSNTAIAQILNYWKYPSSASFDQNDKYTSKTIKIDDDYQIYDFPSFTVLNQKLTNIKYNGNQDEVSALSFACGISTKTQYGSGGSSTNTSYLIGAFKNKFKYASADMKYKKDSNFYNVLELNAKNFQPVLLGLFEESSGNYISGHAVVADGFRDTGEYHLNFGWYGYTDGWYFLPSGLPEGYNTVDFSVMNIKPSTNQSTVELTSPNGSERWKGGSIHNVTWKTAGADINQIHLQYSTDNWNSNQDIVVSTANDGVYEWTVPTINSSKVRVKAIAKKADGTVLAEDASNSDFLIDSTPPITSHKLEGTQKENGWYTTDVKVTLAGTDNLSGVKETKYSINGGAWQVYTNPFFVTGSTVTYYSEDSLGNKEIQKSTGEIKIDKTPPSKPTITDDGDSTISATVLHVIWASSDLESGVAEYQYSVGKTPGGVDVKGWTSAGIVTDFNITGLSLTIGQAYYISAKVKNKAGLWSETGTSNGIVVVMERSINLKSGWNMISFPGTIINANPSEVVAGNSQVVLPFYLWNPLTFSYNEVSQIKIGEGYWVLALQNTTLKVGIITVSSCTVNLKAGWNMVGSINGNVDMSNPEDTPDNSILLPIYTYNPDTFSYEEKPVIESGSACWILVLTDCTLKLGK